jgi:hypothetical protein
MRRPPFTPKEDSWYSFLLETESTPGPTVRLEDLGQLKQFNNLIGNRTRDFPACSIVPQQTKQSIYIVYILHPTFELRVSCVVSLSI